MALKTSRIAKSEQADISICTLEEVGSIWENIVKFQDENQAIVAKLHFFPFFHSLKTGSHCLSEIVISDQT